jgi:phosphonate transport system substrate-binding protein
MQRRLRYAMEAALALLASISLGYFTYQFLDIPQPRGRPATEVVDEPGPFADRVVPYRLGAVAVVNFMDMFRRFEPLLAFLGESTGWRFELALQPSYHDVTEQLLAGHIDVAYLGPIGFVRFARASHARTALQVLNEHGLPYYRALIVVRNDSPLRSLAEMAGKRMGFTDPESASGYLYPRLMLDQAGVALDDLASFSFYGHHDSALRALLSGEVDAAAVKDVLAVEHLGKELRVLRASEPIPNYVLAFRPGLEPPLRRQIEGSLLELNPVSDRERYRLDQWPMDLRYGFTLTTIAAFRRVENLLDHYSLEEALGKASPPGRPPPAERGGGG